MDTPSCPKCGHEMMVHRASVVQGDIRAIVRCVSCGMEETVDVERGPEECVVNRARMAGAL